jgi:hypothetical protein
MPHRDTAGKSLQLIFLLDIRGEGANLALARIWRITSAINT